MAGKRAAKSSSTRRSKGASGKTAGVSGPGAIAAKAAPFAGAAAKVRQAKRSADAEAHGAPSELVILTGMSGAGKASALRSLEDLGFYSVDNLPLELIPRFADLVRQSAEIERAALVIDVREGSRLERFPAILKKVRKLLATRVLFLDASEEALVRRFSETRRPHPMGREETVIGAIRAERQRLDPIRNVADVILDTTKFNVHELRAHIHAQFEPCDGDATQPRNLTIASMSFGFKNGVPTDADLVFDVRFLPNPHFVPEFRELTGKNTKVAQYVMGFPQTEEFLEKAEDLLEFLLPHYIQEGKSYLTLAFGCTGGQHRSVFIAEEMKRRLEAAGYRVKTAHRDMPR
jgi:UPF0042 nucleotide-binding protein